MARKQCAFCGEAFDANGRRSRLVTCSVICRKGHRRSGYARRRAVPGAAAIDNAKSRALRAANPEARRRYQEQQSARLATRPDLQARKKERQRAWSAKPDVKARRNAAVRARRAVDPDFREREYAENHERKKTPKAQARARERRQERFETDPDYREAVRLQARCDWESLRAILDLVRQQTGPISLAQNAEAVRAARLYRRQVIEDKAALEVGLDITERYYGENFFPKSE